MPIAIFLSSAGADFRWVNTSMRQQACLKDFPGSNPVRAHYTQSPVGRLREALDNLEHWHFFFLRLIGFGDNLSRRTEVSQAPRMAALNRATQRRVGPIQAAAHGRRTRGIMRFRACSAIGRDAANGAMSRYQSV